MRPHELPDIPQVLLRRSGYVLAMAALHGCRDLVLGAWGCGVFRNDPALVAGAFAGHLRDARWRRQFGRIVFAVFDPAHAHATFDAFERAFATGD